MTSIQNLSGISMVMHIYTGFECLHQESLMLKKKNSNFMEYNRPWANIQTSDLPNKGLLISEQQYLVCTACQIHH
jgi:hypothetical protein